MIQFKHFELMHLRKVGRETLHSILGDREDLYEDSLVLRLDDANIEQLTLRFNSVPGFDGSRLILLRLISRISNEGISQS